MEKIIKQDAGSHHVHPDMCCVWSRFGNCCRLLMFSNDICLYCLLCFGNLIDINYCKEIVDDNFKLWYRNTIIILLLYHYIHTLPSTGDDIGMIPDASFWVQYLTKFLIQLHLRHIGQWKSFSENEILCEHRPSNVILGKNFVPSISI